MSLDPTSNVRGSLARTFTVTGRVQGVGFRWATQEQARTLGLSGWVRNRDDGSVAGLVQGDEAALETFRRWLSHGPRGARVEGLQWDEAEATALRVFTIR